jgi:hypothetical protein
LGEIAQSLQLKDTSVLRDFLSLCNLPEEIQGLISFGKEPNTLSFSVAVEIARVREEEARRSLITAALEHRLSRDEVSAILQRMRRGGLGIQEAVREILRMRPVIERQFLFVGQLPREVRADASDLCLQREIRKAVAELLGASNVLSVSCKNRRYSVLISEEGASQPVVSSKFTPDKLDTYIGSLISSEL